MKLNTHRDRFIDPTPAIIEQGKEKIAGTAFQQEICAQENARKSRESELAACTYRMQQGIWREITAMYPATSYILWLPSIQALEDLQLPEQAAISISEIRGCFQAHYYGPGKGYTSLYLNQIWRGADGEWTSHIGSRSDREDAEYGLAIELPLDGGKEMCAGYLGTQHTEGTIEFPQREATRLLEKEYFSAYEKYSFDKGIEGRRYEPSPYCFLREESAGYLLANLRDAQGRPNKDGLTLEAFIAIKGHWSFGTWDAQGAYEEEPAEYCKLFCLISGPLGSNPMWYCIRMYGRTFDTDKGIKGYASSGPLAAELPAAYLCHGQGTSMY